MKKKKAYMDFSYLSKGKETQKEKKKEALEEFMERF